MFCRHSDWVVRKTTAISRRHHSWALIVRNATSDMDHASYAVANQGFTMVMT